MKYTYITFLFSVAMIFSVYHTSAETPLLSEPDATVNENDSVVIRLNDYVGDIQWQKSFDTELWENLAGETNDTLLFIADSSAFFRAEVIAGDCDPFYSDTTYIFVVPDQDTFICEGTITDPRDGNVYSMVQIGSQCWLAENLKYLPAVSPSTTDNLTQPVYYVYGYQGTDVNEAMESDNYHNYGVLYNWPAALEACPTGWHLPEDEEWTQMTSYLIDNYEDVTEANIGNSLKSCRQVNSPLGGDCDTSEHPRWDSHNTHYGTDDFGFSALPPGVRSTSGTFFWKGEFADFWTSTEASSLNAIGRGIYYMNGSVIPYSNGIKSFGFSVRCIRNLE